MASAVGIATSRAARARPHPPDAMLRAFTDLGTARGEFLDVYAEVAPQFHLPNQAVTAFGDLLDRHYTEPGFTAVLAYVDGESPGARPITSSTWACWARPPCVGRWRQEG